MNVHFELSRTCGGMRLLVNLVRHVACVKFCNYIF